MEGWRQSSTNVITNFLFQTKAVSFWAVFCLYIVLKISLDITGNVSECLVLLFNIVLKYTIDNVVDSGDNGPRLSSSLPQASQNLNISRQARLCSSYC